MIKVAPPTSKVPKTEAEAKAFGFELAEHVLQTVPHELVHATLRQFKVTAVATMQNRMASSDHVYKTGASALGALNEPVN